MRKACSNKKTSSFSQRDRESEKRERKKREREKEKRERERKETERNRREREKKEREKMERENGEKGEREIEREKGETQKPTFGNYKLPNYIGKHYLKIKSVAYSSQRSQPVN